MKTQSESFGELSSQAFGPFKKPLWINYCTLLSDVVSGQAAQFHVGTAGFMRRPEATKRRGNAGQVQGRLGDDGGVGGTARSFGQFRHG